MLDRLHARRFVAERKHRHRVELLRPQPLDLLGNIDRGPGKSHLGDEVVGDQIRRVTGVLKLTALIDRDDLVDQLLAHPRQKGMRWRGLWKPGDDRPGDFDRVVTVVVDRSVEERGPGEARAARLGQAFGEMLAGELEALGKEPGEENDPVGDPARGRQGFRTAGGDVDRDLTGGGEQLRSLELTGPELPTDLLAAPKPRKRSTNLTESVARESSTREFYSTLRRGLGQ